MTRPYCGTRTSYNSLILRHEILLWLTTTSAWDPIDSYMLRNCLTEAERRTQRIYLPKYHQWRCAEGWELISTLCRPWHLMWVTDLLHNPVAYLGCKRTLNKGVGSWGKNTGFDRIRTSNSIAWRTPGHINEKPRQTIIVRKITSVRTSTILQISERAQLSITEEVSHKCLNDGHKSEFL